MQICLIFDLINVNDKYSPWDWDQICIKDYIIYKKLANFMYKKDIHVNRLESVTFAMQMSIFKNKTKWKWGMNFASFNFVSLT